MTDVTTLRLDEHELCDSIGIERTRDGERPYLFCYDHQKPFPACAHPSAVDARNEVIDSGWYCPDCKTMLAAQPAAPVDLDRTEPPDPYGFTAREDALDALEAQK